MSSDSIEGDEFSSAVVRALRIGGDLDELGLTRVFGRVNLREFHAPTVRRERGDSGGYVIDRLGGNIEIHGQSLSGIDFTEAVIPHLRLFDVVVEGCVFDGAFMQDLRCWRTTFRDCSFVGADLRRSALGPYDGEPNVFDGVVFDQADLRSTAWVWAHVRDSTFLESVLDRVDFQSTNFERCRFSGRLSDVMFWKHAPTTPDEASNHMTDVDFSECQFEFVEFRQLDASTIGLPADPYLLIVPDFATNGPAIAQEFSDRRGFRAVLESLVKWAPRPGSGIVNLREADVSEVEMQLMRDRIQGILGER